MSTFFGADVAELRQLATTFENAASQLTKTRNSVGGNVQASPWTGPDASRFRSAWDSQNATQLASAANSLSSAASSLRKNADQQEAASSALGGAIGVHLVGVSNEGARLGNLRDDLSTVFTIAGGIGMVHDGAALLNNVGFLSHFSDLGGLSKFLGPLGAIGGGYAVAADVEAKDLTGALLDSGSTLAGFAGPIAEGIGGAVVGAGVGAVGLGAAALVGLVDVALPYNTEKQDATYAQGFHDLFGPSANANDPTPEQATLMVQRYSGPLGVATMISDQMDATAAPIREAGRAFSQDATATVESVVDNVFHL